jgi:hypothetical protein
MVQGIEPGALQSTATSPFPSPTGCTSASIPAISFLPWPCRAPLHVPGNLLFLPGLSSFLILLPINLSALTSINRRRSSTPATLRRAPGLHTGIIRFSAFMRSPDTNSSVPVHSQAPNPSPTKASFRHGYVSVVTYFKRKRGPSCSSSAQ